MKSWFISAVFVATLAATAVCQQPVASSGAVLTLEQAIDIALTNSRPARNARIEVEKAGDELAAFRTHRLPQLKLTSHVSQPLTTFQTTFEKGVFGNYAGIGPVPAEETLISSSNKTTALVIAEVAQPITQLRRINFQVKQLELGREISAAQLDAKEQAIVNDVKRAYYAILQTQGASVAAEESVKLYREIDRVTGEYVIQQVALKTDHMNVQTQLAKAEYELLTLDNTLRSQKEQLNNLLGREVTMDFAVTDGFETAQLTIRETDLMRARERALSQRPEIKEARVQVEQAKLDKRAKKSEFIPDVSLTFNYISTFNYSNFVPRSVSALGLQVEWEVFDWGRKKSEVSEKSWSITQAENNLKEMESQVVMDVNSKFRKLQEACQLIRIARLSQTAARATVQLVTYKYRLDAVLLKDLLQAQTSLADSNYEYQKTLLSFWTAKADFEKALGEDK